MSPRKKRRRKKAKSRQKTIETGDEAATMYKYIHFRHHALHFRLPLFRTRRHIRGDRGSARWRREELHVSAALPLVTHRTVGWVGPTAGLDVS